MEWYVGNITNMIEWGGVCASMCVLEIERWSFRGWDLYGPPPIIITCLADSPETVNAKQRLCCVVLRVWVFFIYRQGVPHAFSVWSPGDTRPDIIHKERNTPQCTSIYTHTDVEMPVSAHTHAYISQQKRVSQWESGTNCSGRGKCLCSESKSNCLSTNEANGQASMHTGVAAAHTHTHIIK